MAKGEAVGVSTRLKGRCFCTTTQMARAGMGGDTDRGRRHSSARHAPRRQAPCAQQLLLLPHHRAE